MATSRSRSRSMSRSRSRSRSPGERSRSPRTRTRSPSARDEERSASLWVGNLPHDTTEMRVKEFFGKWGKVLEAKIIYDPVTREPRGFGFVKFEDSRDTEDAIHDADGKMFEGRSLKCNTAHGRGGNAPRGGYAPRGGFRGGPAMAMRGRGGHYPPDSRPPAGGYNGHPGQGWGSGGPGPHGGFGHTHGDGYGPGPRGAWAPRGRAPAEPHPAQRRRRSPSSSPGRYSPERRSPAPESRRSRSPSQQPPRTRRRQRSPTATTTDEPTSPRGAAAAKPAAAEPSTAPAPASAPAKPSRKRAPSPTGSTSAHSSRSSGSSGSDRSPPPRDPPQLHGAPASAPAGGNDGSFRRTLVAARARESAEASARTAALEAELEQARAATGELQAKLAAAQRRARRAEDSANQYRKWLVALADATRHAHAGKEAVRLLEAEFLSRETLLVAFLQEADDFLAADRGAKRARLGANEPGGRPLAASAPAPAGHPAPAAGSSNPTGCTDTTASDGEVKLASEPPAEGPPASDKFRPGMKLRVAA